MVTTDPNIFEKDGYVFYPGHGVGKIININEKTFAGSIIKFYVITFDILDNTKKNLTLSVPKTQASKLGLRELTPIVSC